MREMLLKIQQDSFAILVPDRKSLASTYLAARNSGVRHFSVKGSGLARLHYSAVLTKVLWWDLEGKVFHLRTRNQVDFCTVVLID